MKSFEILVAEDEATIATALQYTIQKFFPDSNVDVVNDGEQAWQHILTKQYSLIVSDWNMPKKTGAELLAEIRKIPVYKKTPFLMLTARADRLSVASAMQSGASAYLIKPFEREGLVSKIEQLLRQNRQSSADDDKEEVKGEVDIIGIIDKISTELKQGTINFPVLPEAAFKIIEILNDDSQDLDNIVKTLKLDPSIAPKLIGLANSALFPSSRRINDLEGAVLKIGLEKAKSAAMMVINHGLYNVEDSRYEKLLSKLNHHACAVAFCAKEITIQCRAGSPEELFTMGMLHDAGKLVLVKLIQDHYSDLPYEKVYEILDLLHGQAGAAVLKEWKLPPEVAKCALHHHEVSKEKNYPMQMHIIHLADVFSHTLGYSLCEDDETDLTALSKELGLKLSEEQVASIIKKVEGELGNIIEGL